MREIAITVCVLTAALGLAQEPIAQGTPELERAQTTAKAMATELMGRLMKELSAGGPVQAVRVCSEVAPAIAAAHSKDGVKIRRVTAKARNPMSTPDAFEAERLARLEAAHAAGQPLSDVVEWVEEDGARSLRLLRPIQVGKACLACHGDPATIDPAVKKLLAERYPEDRATGYREGDFRGAVSVIVQAAARGQ
ncbi:MAG: Tll0287-like domain-containing protein [Acidobacteriota bacterium]